MFMDGEFLENLHRGRGVYLQAFDRFTRAYEWDSTSR